LKKFFILLISFLFFISCSHRYTDTKNKYSIPIPALFNIYQTNLDQDLDSHIEKFINTQFVDVVLYDNSTRVNPSLVTIASYPRFINITKINSDPAIEEDFLNEIIMKYGNGTFVNKGTYSYKRLMVAFFNYSFFYEGTDYSYQVSFLSGSIASTQSIYYIAKENSKEMIENSVLDIIKGYRRH